MTNLEIENKTIYMPPVDGILDTMHKENENIFLLGGPGSGKTTIIKAYEKEKRPNEAIIMGSVGIGEYIHLPNEEVFNLYHTCLLLKKMLLFIEETYPLIYENKFSKFSFIVKEILKRINILSFGYNPKAITQYLDKKYYENALLLLDHFLDLTLNSLGYEKLTVIIDEFDKSGSSSRRYQKFVYKLLSKKMQIIATVSDLTVEEDEEKMAFLNQNGKVIPVQYNLDVKNVTEILDRYIFTKKYLQSEKKLIPSIKFILKPETIQLMIDKTKGNISEMQMAVVDLYLKLPTLNKEEYDSYILNILEYAKYSKWDIYSMERTLYLK